MIQGSPAPRQVDEGTYIGCQGGNTTPVFWIWRPSGQATGIRSCRQLESNDQVRVNACRPLSHKFVKGRIPCCSHRSRIRQPEACQRGRSRRSTSTLRHHIN